MDCIVTVKNVGKKPEKEGNDMYGCEDFLRNQNCNVKDELTSDITTTYEDEPLKSIKAQNAIRILIDHFLGKDWYVVDPLTSEQVNAIAVDEIIKKYPKGKFRRIKNK